MTAKSFDKMLDQKWCLKVLFSRTKDPLTILVSIIHRSSQLKKIKLLKINYEGIIPLEKYVTKEITSKKSTGMFSLNDMSKNEIHRR